VLCGCFFGLACALLGLDQPGLCELTQGKSSNYWSMAVSIGGRPADHEDYCDRTRRAWRMLAIPTIAAITRSRMHDAVVGSQGPSVRRSERALTA
jgi:hypothetical protein